MKTNLLSGLLLGLLAAPQTITAQSVPAPQWTGGLITKITATRGGETATGLFEYDEVGRLTKYAYGEGHETYTFVYTDGGIDLGFANDAGVSGVQGHVTLQGNRTTAIQMTGERAMTVSVEYDGQGRISKWNGDLSGYSNNFEMTWEGDDITSCANMRNGSLNTQATFTYDPQKTAPTMLQTLLLGELGSPIGLNNIGPTLQYFMYAGKLSSHLVTATSRTRKGETTHYDYTYEWDAQGHITTLRIGSGNTYLLEWCDMPNSDTGIDSTVGDAAAGGPVYTLSGQRVTAPRKGIHIVGGKKVVF